RVQMRGFDGDFEASVEVAGFEIGPEELIVGFFVSGIVLECLPVHLDGPSVVESVAQQISLRDQRCGGVVLLAGKPRDTAYPDQNDERNTHGGDKITTSRKEPIFLMIIACRGWNRGWPMIWLAKTAVV